MADLAVGSWAWPSAPTHLVLDQIADQRLLPRGIHIQHPPGFRTGWSSNQATEETRQGTGLKSQARGWFADGWPKICQRKFWAAKTTDQAAPSTAESGFEHRRGARPIKPLN